MVPKMKQLIRLDENVANGNVIDVLLIPNEIKKRNKLPNPPPINTNR